MRGRVVLLAVVAASASYAAAPDLGSDAQRAEGKKLYDKFCSQCHGETGDGQGVAAPHLLPLPRNLTTGKFKIRTTPSGALPTTDDLKRVIRNGMPYTSMPAWTRFSDAELTSLAYYVKTFSPDFANPDRAPTPVDLPKAPSYSEESAEAGRKVYEDTGCIACHGDLGRGDGPSAKTLTDDWGQLIRPADFTQRWTFRGGPTREDIFRTMTTGLNGTPMPAFGDALTAEQRWAITDYVYSLGSGDEPGYASLIVAKHLDEPIDLDRGDALFEGAPVARLPIVGQITQPGRDFHPAAISLEVRAVHDGQDLAIRLDWDDMSDETTGKNGPSLPVPIEEEEGATGAPAAQDSSGDDLWGGAEESSSAPSDDLWGESDTTSAPAAEFSDAVAVQIPMQEPSGARKPYFLFGDEAHPVDLWFRDLARDAVEQFVAKGSSAVEPSLAAEVTGKASYADGRWTVVFRRPLRASQGMPFQEGRFAPIAFSVWDGFRRERGSRRGLTQWFSLYVEPSQVESAWGPMLRAGLGVLAVELLIVFLVRRRRSSGSSSS